MGSEMCIRDRDKVLGITRENLTGVRVIRAFGEEEHEILKFDEETDRLKHLQEMAGRISALMNPLTYVVINGGLIVLIYTGALQVEAGILTQGQVVALVNYMSQILVELVKLANLIITVTKAFACGNRIQNIFEIPAGMETSATSTNTSSLEAQSGSSSPETEKGTVEFDHVSLRYYLSLIHI